MKYTINGKEFDYKDFGGTGNRARLFTDDKNVVANTFNIGENEVCAYFDDYDEPVKTTVVLYDENGSSKDQSATGDSTKDSSTKDSSTKDSSSPKTGDASNMYLWLIITLASLAGGAGVLYTAKRKGIFTK